MYMSSNNLLSNAIKFANTNVAIVIGTYVNGYHVIKGLGQHNLPIIALDYRLNPGLWSKYVAQPMIVDYLSKDEKLLQTLFDIGKQLKKKAVLFPTHDHHTKLFAENYFDLSKYYYVPVNPETLLNVLSKEYQYQTCAKIGIPYPKSYFLRENKDIESMLDTSKDLLFPVIVKPFSRAKNSAMGSLFRAQELNNQKELLEFSRILFENISSGFLVSEVVPGEPDNIWAYTAYCDQDSNIIAGWTGRKLTQRPYYYGVFSTARYEFNAIVEQQGIALLKAFKHIGIGEPEFKYDHRDKKYKLIETNPRYMMWHGVATQGGMNLPLIHYYHAIGDTTNLEQLTRVQSSHIAHIVYMHHEFLNILDHKPKWKYVKNAIRSLFLPNKAWGLLDIKDIGPFLCFQKLKFSNYLHKVRGFFGEKS
jgi:D-aspartate ligase